jgi:indole-3-glycerol phosphate synthase
LLKKDFHVHPVQMFEARVHGASAALLIVRALGPDDTRILADAAREAGVEAVFEVRDETELACALDAGAAVIGVNRRNLETPALEPEVLTRILPMIPASCVAIAESGISGRNDVEQVAVLAPTRSSWGHRFHRPQTHGRCGDAYGCSQGTPP